MNDDKMMMHLELPGFGETETALEEMELSPNSRVRQMASRLAGKPNRPHKTLKVLSTDIDDRISLLEWEIQQGKREADVRRIAGRVLKGVPSRDWDGEVNSLFDYTRKVVRYTRDPAGVELFQSPMRAKDHGIGDCDDQCIFLGSLLASVGYPLKLRVISLKGVNHFQHIYLLVGLPPHDPQKYMPLDPSRPEPAGWELPKEQRGLLQDYVVEE